MSEHLTNDEIMMLAESIVAENLKIYRKLVIQQIGHKPNPAYFELTKTELVLIQDYIGGTPEQLQESKMTVDKKLQDMKQKYLIELKK